MLSGVPAIAGLGVLHFAARREDLGDLREMSLGRGLAFVLAGFLLLVLPLVVWGFSFAADHQKHEHPISPTSLFLLAGYLNAVIFWLIWNINAYHHRTPILCQTRWEQNWGEAYSPELKRRLLAPVLDRLETEGKIGELVVDIGSGAKPVSKFLRACDKRKFLLVDVAAKNHGDSATHYVRLNAEHITRPDRLSYRKALVEVCRFLTIEPNAFAPRECATTLIFSDILNYVDYQKVIGGFSKFLKPDGRIIIANLPARGIREEFSENGLKSNEDLYRFLAEENFTIELKEFPCRSKGATEEAEEMIVLVARKT